MAYLSKEAYEGKRRAAERRMMVNAEVESLSLEQHDALSWLCTIRHEIHGNKEAFFHEESRFHLMFWGYIETDINEKLAEAGLPKIKFEYDVIDDYNTDGLVLEELRGEGIEDDDEIDLRIADAMFKIVFLAESFNGTIESYLREIDDEHGTNYCPAGKQRIF